MDDSTASLFKKIAQQAEEIHTLEAKLTQFHLQKSTQAQELRQNDVLKLQVSALTNEVNELKKDKLIAQRAKRRLSNYNLVEAVNKIERLEGYIRELEESTAEGKTQIILNEKNTLSFSLDALKEENAQLQEALHNAAEKNNHLKSGIRHVASLLTREEEYKNKADNKLIELIEEKIKSEQENYAQQEALLKRTKTLLDRSLADKRAGVVHSVKSSSPKHKEEEEEEKSSNNKVIKIQILDANKKPLSAAKGVEEVKKESNHEKPSKLVLLKTFSQISNWLKEQDGGDDKENLSEESVAVQTATLVSILKECKKLKAENGAGVELIKQCLDKISEILNVKKKKKTPDNLLEAIGLLNEVTLSLI